MGVSGDAERLLQHGGNLAAARRLYPRAPEPWIDLSTGINARAYPVGALSEASWRRLPEENAALALEEAARRAYGAPESACVVAAPGTQALIGLLPLLAPAKRVGILDFTYSEHELCWAGAGAQVETVDNLDALGGFDHAVIVNPNNPDGRLVPPPALLALAERLAARGGRLIVDEAFVDFLPPEASVAPLLPPSGMIVLRSFGKAYGLAGLRLGFALAGAAEAARMRRALGPWPVSGAAIEIGLRALGDALWRDEARARANQDAGRLDEMLRAAGFTPAGGTPLFRWIRCPDAHRAFRRLAGAGVLVRAFGSQPQALRFGVPTGEAIWEELARRLKMAGL
jgi:cobalamin biosynthetic protein CobC